jgi:hypothetical protein
MGTTGPAKAGPSTLLTGPLLLANAPADHIFIIISRLISLFREITRRALWYISRGPEKERQQVAAPDKSKTKTRARLKRRA